MTHIYPKMDEKHHSQLPAMQVLQAMGYEYIDIDTAKKYRGHNMSNVVLDDIVLANLQQLNAYTVNGQQYAFSDGNLQNALDKLKQVTETNFISESKKKYELLRLGTSETVLQDGKDKTIRYIDWKNPENNQYHMTAEYTVRRSNANTAYRPDIVLFVNGIPFVIIECKAPHIDTGEAVSQHIRNQQADGIRHLYKYAQILIATKNIRHVQSEPHPVQYATTGTSKKYWNIWHEKQISEQTMLDIVNTPCKAYDFYDIGTHEPLVTTTETLTEQAKTLISLCRPDRLLQVSADGILYDKNVKKIARYQQFFAVQKIINRIQTESDPKKRGGVVWHTQGSGKSLTMVMTAEKIASCTKLKHPRIIIVTDRLDLDDQIKDTFVHCGYDKRTIHQCKSGRDLSNRIQEKRTRVLTTLVQKFESAVKNGKCIDTDDNIFIMIDEAHRTQYGQLAIKMEQTFPNATYIGFTGTPLMKRNKNTYAKFGTVIDQYTIDQAVQDKAIVPLLYEGRLAVMEVHGGIDVWFDRVTQDLTEKQKSDLKRRYGKLKVIHESDPVIDVWVQDIQHHFTQQIQPYGFKGQVVVNSREAAVKFQNAFERYPHIKTQVVMTLADKKHDATDVHVETNSLIADFKKHMLDLYKDEKTYTEQTIQRFRNGDLDIVIVVDKLLTGFDVPANSVMYLCKELMGHNLLQAIARVNRLHDEHKLYGLIIDYVGILGDLQKSLNTYTALQDFNEADILNAVQDIHKEVAKLDTYDQILAQIFRGLSDQENPEPYIDVLRTDAVRDDFYDAVTKFTQTLELGLSTLDFHNNHDESQIEHYKKTAKFYQKLKYDAKIRFNEIFEIDKYKSEIKRLVDKHLIADTVEKTIESVDILNTHKVNKILQDTGQSNIAKADTIAFATNKIITEKIQEDPEFYKKFSNILRNCIENFKTHRDAEKYLEQVVDIRNKVAEKRHERLPDGIESNTFEAIIYGNTRRQFYDINENVFIQAVKDITKMIIPYTQQVDFGKNIDAQNKLRQEIVMYVYHEIEVKYKLEFNNDDLTRIQDIVVNITRNNKAI